MVCHVQVYSSSISKMEHGTAFLNIYHYDGNVLRRMSACRHSGKESKIKNLYYIGGSIVALRILTYISNDITANAVSGLWCAVRHGRRIFLQCGHEYHVCLVPG